MVQSEVRIGAVILGWNHKQDSVECIRSIFDARQPGLHLWFVDNGSTDGSAQLLRQTFPAITVLELGKNFGLVLGYNAGIQAAIDAGCEFVCIFNNDVIVQPGAMKGFLTAAQGSSHVGIWAPKIVFHPDNRTIWSAGARRRHVPPGIVQRGMGRPAATSYTENEQIEYATNCVWMMSAGMVREVGLFNPKYSFYYSDYEYCRRVVGHGWEILYLADTIIEHKVSVSTINAPRPARWWRNLGEAEAAYFRTYESKGLLLAHAAWIIVRALLQGDVAHVSAYASGLRSGLRR